jgi:hypothetical protein
MTTSKPYHGREIDVAFLTPTVGSTVYAIENPSGWCEVYNREAADKALAQYLVPLDVAAVLAQFKVMLSVLPEKRAENWQDVTEYLAQITGTPRKLIPAMVATSFWGQYLMLDNQEGTN